MTNHAGSSASPSSEVAEDNDNASACAIQGSSLLASIHPIMPPESSSSGGSSRRNKRKNFQPRNIRTADADAEVNEAPLEDVSDASGPEANPQEDGRPLHRQHRLNGHARAPRHLPDDRRKRLAKLCKLPRSCFHFYFLFLFIVLCLIHSFPVSAGFFQFSF